jgi:hypothetical protein
MLIEQTHTYKVIRSLSIKTLRKAVQENPYFLHQLCLAMSLEYGLSVTNRKRQAITH